MTPQTELPLAGVTLCGYCDRPLSLQPEGDWACNRCRPALRAISGTWPEMVRQYRQFQREARR